MANSAKLPKFERLVEIDSTNAEAMRRAIAGEPGPVWISAARQTAGRGRAGRTWTSDGANLYASLLVCFNAPSPKAYQLALVAGVAVHDALSPLLPPSERYALQLKWPNDILICGEKVGGILIESTTVMERGGASRLAAIIGIGVNIAEHPQGLDRAATSLSNHGASLEPEALLARISNAAAHWIDIWAEGAGFAAVRDAWLLRAHPIGERMSINTGSERVTGTFGGLDPEGGLLIDGGTGIRRFAFGDVSLAR